MLRLAVGFCPSVPALCLLQATLAALLHLIGLFAAPALIDCLKKGRPLGILLAWIGGLTLGRVLVGALAAYVRENKLYGRVWVRSELVRQIHNKFAQTSYPNVNDPAFLKLQDKASMAVCGNDEAGEAIWTTMEGLIQSAAELAVYAAVLTAVDRWVLVLTLASAALCYVFGKRMNSWGYWHRQEESVYSREMNYVNQKAADAALAKDVRIFDMPPWLVQTYQEAFDRYQGFHARAAGKYIWADVLKAALALLRNGVVYGYLIFLVLRGTLGAAQFLLYFTAIAGFASLTGAMLGHLTMLNRQSLELSAIREYLEAPECFAFETGRSIRPDPRRLYEIRLENVSFRYPGAQEDILSGIDLTLHPGEKLAVVGLNGTGKTTLVKLICGFLDPTQGRVLFGGQDVRTFNRRDYYAHFAAVFQDYSVLAATVAENVAQTDQTQLDERRVWLCLEKAGLAQKIQSLPNGVQTHLGKQVYEAAPELSGGELQRLMLARALYKDAPVLILDEPIAALDPIAETEIYAGFDAIVGNKTALYISHRLSSCRFCDKICVFDAGKIVQRGSHEQLVEDKGGLYFRLWQAHALLY